MTEKEKIEWLKRQIKNCESCLDHLEKKKDIFDEESYKKSVDETEYLKQIYESELKFIYFLDKWGELKF